MFTRTLFSLILAALFCLPLSAAEIQIPFGSPKGLPYFVSPQLSVDAEEYNTAIIRIKSEKPGTARLFWATSYNPQFNQPKSIWFYLKQGERNYYFNIPSQNRYWMGWAQGLLIYPDMDLSLVEIKEAKMVSGNLLTNIRSGWQEFWGPNGREVIGSTINLIPSSAIFGRSVNVYIYWMLGIFFVLFLAFQLYQNKGKFNLSFENSVKKTFVLALVCWVLLALNSDLNFFKIFKANFSKYFGKSIQWKRAAAAYSKDYYEFLVFAKEKLPQEPIAFGVLSSRYAPSLHARIYLVPHVFVENQKDCPYLLIFHPSPEQTYDPNKYSLFAKLKNDEYILKRNKQ